jgi:hypothetical protein
MPHGTPYPYPTWTRVVSQCITKTDNHQILLLQTSCTGKFQDTESFDDDHCFIYDSLRTKFSIGLYGHIHPRWESEHKSVEFEHWIGHIMHWICLFPQAYVKTLQSEIIDCGTHAVELTSFLSLNGETFGMFSDIKAFSSNVFADSRRSCGASCRPYPVKSKIFPSSLHRFIDARHK